MDSEPCIKMLKALADETRWQITRELLSRSHVVGELAECLGISQYNASKHIRILREAGIVTTRKHGKMVECDVEPSFRQKLDEGGHLLDLGCCTFRFDQSPSKIVRKHPSTVERG